MSTVYDVNGSFLPAAVKEVQWLTNTYSLVIILQIDVVLVTLACESYLRKCWRSIKAMSIQQFL